MTATQSNRVVCRLLGGTGRARLAVVPTPKLPSLLRPGPCRVEPTPREGLVLRLAA